MSDNDDRSEMEIAGSILENIRESKERQAVVSKVAERIRDSTAARGVDVWAVEDCGFDAVEWAVLTDRDRSTVARNVRRGK